PYSYILLAFNDPLPTKNYTLALPDALPIYRRHHDGQVFDHAHGGDDRIDGEHRVQHHDLGHDDPEAGVHARPRGVRAAVVDALRSEEHTSELQSRENLVCRLLLENKNI